MGLTARRETEIAVHALHEAHQNTQNAQHNLLVAEDANGGDEAHRGTD